MSSEPRRVLVAGWYSFPNGHATAGDLLCRDLVCAWLAEHGIAYDAANEPLFGPGVNWRLVNPHAYSHLVFVCGPFGRGELEYALLSRFASCRLIGLNLSMSLRLDEFNPFDTLIERDSSSGVNADLVFGTKQKFVPVVGVCLVEDHPEADTTFANGQISRTLAEEYVAAVSIDTRLDANTAGLRTPAEVESLIARMDALVTTRLHGLALALKNGVPVLAVDAVRGSGKISRQCQQIGWPNVLTLDQLGPESLRAGLEYALHPAASEKAKSCARNAAAMVDEIQTRFGEAMRLNADGSHFTTRATPEELASFLLTLSPQEQNHTSAPASYPDNLTIWQRILQRIGHRRQSS